MTFRVIDERRPYAVTREQWAERITYVPNSPSRGARIRSGEQKPAANPDWRELAACRGKTTSPDSVWINPTHLRRREVVRAQALCMTCPVIDDCRAQPLPHVGITAGVVYWNGPRPSKGAGECRQCGELVVERLYCSPACKYRWHYENSDPVRWDAAPLLAYLDGWSVREIVEKLLVSRKTVHRWRNTGEVAPSTGRAVCRRLRIDPSDLWPGVS